MRRPVATGIELDDSSFTMKPVEAREAFANDPRDCWFGLTEIMRAFGLDERQLRTELESGRLLAHGRPVNDGSGDWTGVAIRGDSLMRWMSETGRKIDGPLDRATGKPWRGR